ncbi:MAG TPA: TetR/AcrR family transcriptional regulator [Actinospica sp.]|nr:TetR/AcrR family transcriptional regulator [Actinospica sp.]
MDSATEAPVISSSPRRAELLARTLEYAARTNLSELSLRPLAAEIGSSPRVLLYLFGSKEGLLREVLAASRAQQLALVHGAMAQCAEPEEVLGRLWAWMCEPGHRSIATLFFEAYTRSLGGGEPWATFALDSVRDWEPPLRSILTRRDAPPPTDADVTLALAVLRGLLLDLLATGEAERVDLAWRRYVELNRRAEGTA